MRAVPYPHPGEILLEEFLTPLDLSQYKLAKEISVPQGRIGEIIAGRRSITADTALRLAKFFGTTEKFWQNLQEAYDAPLASHLLGDTLESIHPLKRIA